MANRKSRYALALCCVMIAVTHIYYPKWKMERTEATISWDVSGYYMYLPAMLIYHDLDNCGFQDNVIQTYQPSTQFDQAYLHESGKYVMKYASGMAVQYLPSFLVAHLWASVSSVYPADGFSFPYQFMISMGSLLIAFLGLIFLRLSLLKYFSDKAVAFTLLAIVFGTNYLNYSAIDGAMSHNYLFTLYSLLLYQTIRFHERSSVRKSLGIGLIIGLAALTRPSEILALLIPVLWGTNLFVKGSLRSFPAKVWLHRKYITSALFGIVAIGILQPIYWKTITGEWLIYSYRDEGFQWLSPEFWKGMMSYRNGWLIYSPIMVFAILGFLPLFKKHKSIFSACLIFTLVFMYITFSWHMWWYGTSLGQRNMIQAYPILAFPLTMFVERILTTRLIQKSIVGILCTIFVFANLWFTHQAHRGGLLYPGQMTGAYFWRTFGRFEAHRDDLKLLDTSQDFRGERTYVNVLYTEDFETASGACEFALNGIPARGMCLNNEVRMIGPFQIPIDTPCDWVRVHAMVYTWEKEWVRDKMAELQVTWYNGEERVKLNKIRVHRLLNGYDRQEIFIDSKSPDAPYDRIEVVFAHPTSNVSLAIDNLKVESFEAL